MKKLPYFLISIISYLLCSGLVFAGTGKGSVIHIKVLENRDVVIDTKDYQNAPPCAQESQSMVLLHDNPDYLRFYTGMIAASALNAQVTVEGSGQCTANGEEIISNFLYKLHSELFSSRSMRNKMAPTQELNQLLEELMQTSNANLVNTYDNLFPTDIDCLLLTLRQNLTDSQKVDNIVVPDAHNGNVTFTLKGLPTYKFNLRYDYDASVQSLRVEIVQKPYFVTASTIWELLGDGKMMCIN